MVGKSTSCRFMGSIVRSRYKPVTIHYHIRASPPSRRTLHSQEVMPSLLALIDGELGDITAEGASNYASAAPSARPQNCIMNIDSQPFRAGQNDLDVGVNDCCATSPPSRAASFIEQHCKELLITTTYHPPPVSSIKKHTCHVRLIVLTDT